MGIRDTELPQSQKSSITFDFPKTLVTPQYTVVIGSRPLQLIPKSMDTLIFHIKWWRTMHVVSLPHLQIPNDWQKILVLIHHWLILQMQNSAIRMAN